MIHALCVHIIKSRRSPDREYCLAFSLCKKNVINGGHYIDFFEKAPTKNSNESCSEEGNKLTEIDTVDKSPTQVSFCMNIIFPFIWIRHLDSWLPWQESCFSCNL